jgi:hypothetical protein
MTLQYQSQRTEIQFTTTPALPQNVIILVLLTVDRCCNCHHPSLNQVNQHLVPSKQGFPCWHSSMESSNLKGVGHLQGCQALATRLSSSSGEAQDSFVEQRKRKAVVRKGAPGFGELEGFGGLVRPRAGQLAQKLCSQTWVTNKPLAWFGLWEFDLAGQTNLLLT